MNGTRLDRTIHAAYHTRMKIFRVGGSVRDELLGRKTKDRDYVVFQATEDRFLQHFPGARKVGRKACVYIVGGDEYTLTEAPDITADLLQRDLTINAMARDDAGRLFSHPLALSDLEHKILRPVSEKNFHADPLRIFRAARFTAGLPDFRVHQSLLPVMQAVGQTGRLAGLAAERVGHETRRACHGRQPGNYLRLLSQTGCLSPWFAELQNAKTIPAGPKPVHDGSLLAHTVQVMDSLAGEALEVWMGLCHDLGKTVTPPGRWPHHHDHARAGQALAVAMGHRLKLPRRFILAGAIAARWHMTAGDYDHLRTGTVVHLLTTLHKSFLVEALFSLVAADKGIDFRLQARKDLQTILSVRLPEKHRNRGDRSGEILHHLRCEAIDAGGRWKAED